MALDRRADRTAEKQAEELLFSGPQTLGFAKGLFFGHFNAPLLFPYPTLNREQADEAAAGRGRGPPLLRRAHRRRRHRPRRRHSAGSHRRPRPARRARHDRPEGIRRPRLLAAGLHARSWKSSAATTPASPSSSTPTTASASAPCCCSARRSKSAAGCRRWSRGEQLAAFALTEPEAGSDASNVQTTATPTADGEAYLLNGTKRYITNGGIAEVLTVMARTPGAGADKKKEITAFLVTPDMPGFEVVEARMPKWASAAPPRPGSPSTTCACPRKTSSARSARACAWR